MFASLFHSLFYQPIFNLFIWLYVVVPGHDFGVVILLITILLRVVLFPFTAASINAQRSVQALQPKLAEIKKNFATDQQAQAAATMALYKDNKVNPFASCLPLLIQLPILIALYLVLRDGIMATDIGKNLYPFVHNPGVLNINSLGLINLAKPNIVLAVLAGIAQYVQTKSLTRQMPPREAGSGAADEDMLVAMNKSMVYTMPILTVIIGLRLPGGLSLYWFVSTALMALQQWAMEYRNKKQNDASTSTINS